MPPLAPPCRHELEGLLRRQRTVEEVKALQVDCGWAGVMDAGCISRTIGKIRRCSVVYPKRGGQQTRRRCLVPPACLQEKLDAIDDERQAHAGIFAHAAATTPGVCLQ